MDRKYWKDMLEHVLFMRCCEWVQPPFVIWKKEKEVELWYNIAEGILEYEGGF